MRWIMSVLLHASLIVAKDAIKINKKINSLLLHLNTKPKFTRRANKNHRREGLISLFSEAVSNKVTKPNALRLLW